jgi:four helix bundle protein
VTVTRAEICTRGPEQPPFDIDERAALFADRCIKVALVLPGNSVAWELARQLVRSAGSVGANLAESKGAISKRDFQHKVSIALREARETLYWLERIGNAELIRRDRPEPLIGEANEVVSILTVILRKARARPQEGKT